MELTDVKPQMLINIKEEESCTDVNTEMTNTACMEIETGYPHCDYVSKRELEMKSASDKIKPFLKQNVMKEDMFLIICLLG